MTLFINNKDKTGIAKLGGKIAESSSLIKFTEATYKLDDSGNFGTLSFIYESATDTKPVGDNLPIEVGQIVQLKFTVKDYESKFQDRVDKKLTSDKEQAWHTVLTDVMVNKEAISGFIDLSQPPMMITAKGSGKNQLGVDLDPNFLAMLAGQVCEFVAVPLDKLKDLPVSEKKGYGGGKSSQSEKDRLTDRLNFLVSYETDNKMTLGHSDKLNYVMQLNLSLDF